MVNVLYCTSRTSRKHSLFSLPGDRFSLHKSSSIKSIRNNKYPIVIIEESFLKRRCRGLPFSLNDKVFLLDFSSTESIDFATVQNRGFFDFLCGEDGKKEVLFKLERAQKYLELCALIGKYKAQIAKKDERIEKIALTDPLTGCYNWRYFLHRVHVELKRSQKYLHSVSFIGIDIDRFRQINELYGVRVADSIVKKLVKVFRRYLRDEDVISRWRGDEFFIIAPHLVNENAYIVAEEIKAKINKSKFKYKDLSLRVKVSIGVVSSPSDNVFNIRDVIGSLNKCLINAKRKGGDSIMLCSSPQVRRKVDRKKRATINELRVKIDKMDKLLTRDLLEMIYGFARAIEAKDAYTGKHVEYTSLIAENVAKHLRLPKKEVTNIKHAAVLHDLGKVGIDSKILLKKGALTRKEREVIKTHPSIAAEILREIQVLREAIPAVLYHHERYDGKGYPLGLKGEEIPLSARIVAVADVYQALISDRPYRRAFKKNKALKLIKQESGTHFDPKITEIFLKIVKQIDG